VLALLGKEIDHVVDSLEGQQLTPPAAMAGLSAATSLASGPFALAPAPRAWRITRWRQIRVSRVAPKPLEQLGYLSFESLDARVPLGQLLVLAGQLGLELRDPTQQIHLQT
jgi:hypothetical protein